MEDVLKIENSREEKNLRKIYFFKDGNSPWYRAYELSAYYAVHYNNELKESERLQAIRRASKVMDNGVIQIGLQITSFHKYFPNAQINEISDTSLSLDVPNDDFLDVTFDGYKDIVSEWKETFELKSKSKKMGVKEPLKTVYNSPVSFTGIMKEIIRFDSHGKSESDLRNFVYTLKEMCANLI